MEVKYLKSYKKVLPFLLHSEFDIRYSSFIFFLHSSFFLVKINFLSEDGRIFKSMSRRIKKMPDKKMKKMIS